MLMDAGLCQSQNKLKVIVKEKYLPLNPLPGAYIWVSMMIIRRTMKAYTDLEFKS